MKIDTEICPACSSKSVSIKLQFNGLNVYWCKSCTLEFAEMEICDRVIDTDPVFFHNIVDGYEIQSQVAHEILPRRLDTYCALLGRTVRRVLEVGCATGAWGRAFESRGCNYVGLEVDGEMADRTRKRTGLDIRNENFLDSDFDEPFDVIFSSQVLEHVTDPRAFMRKGVQNCKNGIIHIDVPNHDSLASRLRKVNKWGTEYGFIQPPYHMIAYNKKALGGLMADCGISLIHCEGIANNHTTWGQLISRPRIIQRLQYGVAGRLGMGSLLFALGIVKEPA